MANWIFSSLLPMLFLRSKMHYCLLWDKFVLSDWRRVGLCEYIWRESDILKSCVVVKTVVSSLASSYQIFFPGTHFQYTVLYKTRSCKYVAHVLLFPQFPFMPDIANQSWQFSCWFRNLAPNSFQHSHLGRHFSWSKMSYKRKTVCSLCWNG